MPPIMPEPHWTQIMTALLTPMIAGIAILIAYRQWKTAHEKLKFDRFDRRFAVYDTARNLLGSIITTGIKKDTLFEFDAGTREAKWLLNDEIVNYLQKELGDKAYELKTLIDVLNSLSNEEERKRNIKKQTELKKWFLAQYSVLDQKFAPFLKLKQ